MQALCYFSFKISGVFSVLNGTFSGICEIGYERRKTEKEMVLDIFVIKYAFCRNDISTLVLHTHISATYYRRFVR